MVKQLERIPRLIARLWVGIPWTAADDQKKLERLKNISMLSYDCLAKLRKYARKSQGAIVEVGSYIGGSTCAIADAVRDNNRPVIAIEPGGTNPMQPFLPSNDILKDRKNNVAAWRLDNRISLIPKLAHDATDDLSALLEGQKIGFLLIDADGSPGAIIDSLRPFIGDRCMIVLDDFADDLKGAQVRKFIDAARANGSLEQLEFDEFGFTWFGRLTGAAMRLPATYVGEIGHAWLWSIGFHGPSDDTAAPQRSTLRLFEDGRPLGPLHSVHDDIRKFGEWKGRLYFSSSDNTDPNTNGRTYTVQS